MYETTELLGVHIGRDFLTVMPRLPFELEYDRCYSGDDAFWKRLNEESWEEHKHRFALEETVNDEWQKTYLENSKVVFSDAFLDGFATYKLSLAPTGIVCRHLGYDLSSPSHRRGPAKILQIGCGPSNFFENGPIASKELESLGAHVTNLDVLDVAQHYTHFRQGSWFDIDTLFDEKFDVIFMHMMDPDAIGDQVRQLTTPFKTESMVYRELLLKTMYCLEQQGLFFISGISDCDFGFEPDWIPRKIKSACVGNFEIDGVHSRGIRGHTGGVQLYQRLS